MVFKLWSPGEQIQHHLRNLLERKILRYQSDLLSKTLQRWDPATRILTSPPGDSDACSSLRSLHRATLLALVAHKLYGAFIFIISHCKINLHFTKEEMEVQRWEMILLKVTQQVSSRVEFKPGLLNPSSEYFLQRDDVPLMN